MSPALEGGLHRLLGDPDTVARTLAAAGWRVATVPPVASTGAFWTAISTALELPDWFGRNLDALWDCLTDLEEPTAVVLQGWTRYATARPEPWDRVLGVLRDRAAIRPPFAVVLADER